jgi:hypothetical protein
VSRWDVGNVKNFERMFGMTDLDQQLGNWCTASATNMRRMFYRTKYFNSNLNSWDVGNVEDFSYMRVCSKKADQKGTVIWTAVGRGRKRCQTMKPSVVFQFLGNLLFL